MLEACNSRENESETARMSATVESTTQDAYRPTEAVEEEI